MIVKECKRVSIAALLGMVLSAAAAHAQTSRPTTQPVRAAARYLPQASDDVAWENDRIAFRVYGPALEKEMKTGSGIDVWVKSTSAMVIDRWYKADDYRRDHGEGLDFYSVGEGRGCGGLTYAPWAAGARKVWETRRIILDAGSNLNRIESRIDSDTPGELIVGIGIVQRLSEGGEATLDKRAGMIAYWQPADPQNGTIGCGILVDPASVVRLVNADQHYLALIRVTPGNPFVYYAGAGWSKGGFATREAWEKYMHQYATNFQIK
jgi:unsaturated rhamnogalacturonyl hydrolase